MHSHRVSFFLARSTRVLRRHLAPALALATLTVPARVLAAFGVTSSGGNYVVDTGASPSFVFSVSQTNGDIMSIKRGGTELQISSGHSQVNSGLGNCTVTATTIGTDRIKITCTLSDGTIHYYIAKSGHSLIYMATYVTHDTEWRFIPRLQNALFDGIPQCSDYESGGTAIESADTVLLNGTTRSKYSGNKQMKDDVSHGASGTAGTATMWMGVRETSSGGPFFRDIQISGDSNMTNPYNYMKSGHAQTESWRAGLHGPYALSFSGSPDFGSWWDTLGLTGWVTQAGRGRVNATISGGDFVGYSNASAQYWSGAGLSPYMKPGTYTMTLFKGELAVATSSVSVTAGGTTNKSISSTFSFPATIWRFGTWDGKPSEFMNAANVLVMHPSDSRNAAWGPKTIPVTNSPSTWPCYMFRDVNDGCKLTFTLTSAQVANHTIRIGITAANSGGRPQIQVNNWLSAAPASSTQPASRILTIGTYRGNNVLYTYAVPASAFVSGTNTLTIRCISGSTSSSPWTGPSFSFDCIELLN
jgi:rhamnogalacturonan endolyase